MNSLFNVKFNWNFYIVIIILIRLIWVDISWLSFIAIVITVQQFLLLFYSIGSVIPIRYLAGSFMCLQMLLGPTLAYNGVDAIQRIEYQMKVPETVYFSYAIPSLVLFICGLNIGAGKLKGELLNINDIRNFIQQSGDLPYVFVAVGFVSTFISSSFGSELGFVFYLLSSFKFIGAFMLILGKRKVKTWVLLLVFGSIILSTLQRAMFHDLLTWLIMLGAVFAIKVKPNLLLKSGAAVAFIILAIIIQQVKGDYRKAAWGGAGGGAGWDSFEQAVNEKNENNSLFDKQSLAKSSLRINQGYILTNILNYVPAKVPFANGEELLVIIEAAFLPRIIAPNKLNAGDRTIFTKYTGINLLKGTSMGMGAMGDAYVNFGMIGGSLFMLVWGLMFNIVLKGFYIFSKTFPVILLFTPLVFYYPIRPDCELQTSMGHLVKSSMLLYLMMRVWSYSLRKKQMKHYQVHTPQLGDQASIKNG